MSSGSNASAQSRNGAPISFGCIPEIFLCHKSPPSPPQGRLARASWTAVKLSSNGELPRPAPIEIFYMLPLLTRPAA